MTIYLARDFVIGNLGCTPLGVPSDVNQASTCHKARQGFGVADLGWALTWLGLPLGQPADGAVVM